MHVRNSQDISFLQLIQVNAFSLCSIFVWNCKFSKSEQIKKTNEFVHFGTFYYKHSGLVFLGLMTSYRVQKTGILFKKHSMQQSQAFFLFKNQRSHNLGNFLLGCATNVELNSLKHQKYTIVPCRDAVFFVQSPFRTPMLFYFFKTSEDLNYFHEKWKTKIAECQENS